jgi:hypothetical protein
VLHVLRGRDHSGIENVGRRLFLDELLSLLQDAFHTMAFLAARTFVELGTDALDASDVLARLTLVRRERLLEFGMRGLLDHLRKRFEDLLLGAVEILELLDIQIFQGVELHIVLLWQS